MPTYNLRAFRVIDNATTKDSFSRASVQISASEDLRLSWMPGPDGVTPTALSGVLFDISIGNRSLAGSTGSTPGTSPATATLLTVTQEGVASTFVVFSTVLSATATEKLFVQIDGPPTPEFRSLWAMNQWFAGQTVVTNSPATLPPVTAEGVPIHDLPSTRSEMHADIVQLAEGRSYGAFSTGRGDDQVTGNALSNHIDLGTGNDRASGGAGADTLNGGMGNDRLAGDAGADVLSGGAGRDTLTGGAGDDLLSGGIGADRFIFTRAAGTDTVLDFQDDIDRIDLRAFRLTPEGLATRLSQIGDDVRIDLAPGIAVIVENTTLAALSDDLLV